MISAPEGSVYATIVALVRAYPGEYSDRPIWVGRVCVAGVPEVGERALPRRWPERMREAGLLRPARVRLAAHVVDRHVARLEGQARRVVELLQAADDGMGVGSLVEALGGDETASGALKETLQGLYRDGLVTPPGAVWAVTP